jgi:hypothetical protein
MMKDNSQLTALDIAYYKGNATIAELVNYTGMSRLTCTDRECRADQQHWLSSGSPIDPTRLITDATERARFMAPINARVAERYQANSAKAQQERRQLIAEQYKPLHPELFEMPEV